MSKCTVCSEALWCCCRKKKTSPLCKATQFTSRPHTWMSQIIIWIYFHCYYNGLQSMSEAALNTVLVYVPEEFISPSRSYEYGGGWSVWVEAIDSMYLRWCQARRIRTRSDGSYLKCRGGYLCDSMCKPPSTAVTCNKSNNLPSSQTVGFLNIKLLMRRGTWEIVIHRYRATCTLSPLFLSLSLSPSPLPCQLISRPSRYCYKGCIQTPSIMPAHTFYVGN